MPGATLSTTWDPVTIGHPESTRLLHADSGQDGGRCGQDGRPIGPDYGRAPGGAMARPTR